MSENFLRYLEREHARLEAAIAEQQRRLWPDDAEIARLKKAKLLVKDQLARWRNEAFDDVAA
ncbi:MULTISPECIES: YdcH family protein [unclassified Sphingomonas]|uniref:YdcH family protein n=1 Tax=unclassified Sphingomonas TaxID=196159 RepID=UPI0007005552|nr:MULTISPECIES: YdcH family protein [unclassified Sphingomonas]KQX25063.1 hypothetical protein ASD17_23585 [Sphingomonas sp. Root1294]KQY66080.1 hypothetical protein ASD39_13385 [Sphingomonas sp. Root50]KRB89757.1 hypothetical protein ASE22_19210 [Sphingomonas sp. Root720]